jgi:Collagen triple helix repeat (20 copies)
MFSAIRKRFTYANVAMTLALVFAMSGGAYAAKHYLITSTKQISPKVLKALAGKTGPAGPEGKAGVPGSPGTPGSKGEKGEPGTNGTNGTSGESVTNTAVPTTSTTTCSKLGGAEFKVGAGKATTACNGKEGSAWTAGGTLPKGSTEKGVWSATIVEQPFYKTFNGVGTVSFVIPLSASPTVEFIKEGEAGKEHAAECPGTTPTEPKAAEGYLCVYTGAGGGAAAHAEFEEAEAFTAGALIKFKGLAAGFTAFGTWAVTAK